MTTKTRINKKITAISVLIAILFVSSIVGTVIHYNEVVTQKNSQIASLTNQVSNRNCEISILNGEISNLSSQLNYFVPNITAAVGVAEISGSSSHNMSPQPYDHLWITGSVTNKGRNTAYSAGLHVVAYAANGIIEINQTFPLVNALTNSVGIFGADNATITYASSLGGSTLNSFQLGSLGAAQTADVAFAIYHEGIVTKWTVTPVWTNSP